ncbi:MAG TPA: hypothetical protein VKA19_11685, partial [Alphaproteobacteria bacterium]|nr:hypothetical protein [Alphaproteobacteria bacterium]
SLFKIPHESHASDLVNIPPLKLEIGAHYRLRGGREAVILGETNLCGEHYGVLIGGAVMHRWLKDGSYVPFDEFSSSPSVLDIVERIS